ncbi:MAG TPA: hypothetical protein GX507_11605 [Clostridia bacterium]|nr:hypothetical protein [Clostridia bacterium]
MILGEILGIRFRINGLYMLLFLVCIAAGLLKETLIVISVLLSHEFAHIVAAAGLGVVVKEVELYPFGGIARVEWPDGADPSLETLVSIAGPLNNLILGAAAWWLARSDIWDIRFLDLFIETNLTLATLNLVPALPLDGGRALRGLLTTKKGYRQATATVCKVGKALALTFLILSPIAVFLFGSESAGISFIVCSFFVYSGAKAEERWVLCAQLRATAKKKETLTSKGLMPLGEVAALARSSLGEVSKSLSPHKYHMIVIMDEDMKVLGTITETRLFECMLEYGYSAPLSSAL